MLYDPKWEKPEVLSLAGLIAWLETQPADRTYNYYCGGTCLLDSYLSAVTGKPSTPSPDTHWVTCGGPSGYSFIAQSHPWTYGAALERARTALTSHMGTKK